MRVGVLVAVVCWLVAASEGLTLLPVVSLGLISKGIIEIKGGLIAVVAILKVLKKLLALKVAKKFLLAKAYHYQHSHPQQHYDPPQQYYSPPHQYHSLSEAQHSSYSHYSQPLIHRHHKRSTKNGEAEETVMRMETLMAAAVFRLDTHGCVSKLICCLKRKGTTATLEEHLLLHLFSHSPQFTSNDGTEKLDAQNCNEVNPNCPLEEEQLLDALRLVKGCDL